MNTISKSPSLDQDLEPSYFLDFKEKTLSEFIQKNCSPESSQFEQAIELYYAVRDQIRYDPYTFSLEKAEYKASFTLTQNRGWCVTKSVLYAALCRLIGVPARLGFADVKNHLSTENMRKKMQTDVFYWHGYTSVFLENKWVKATTAFNIELCEKFGLKPLEFNGREDSIYHAFDLEGNAHMEYLNERGEFHDLPFEEMIADFKKFYPAWSEEKDTGDFAKEVEKETK